MGERMTMPRSSCRIHSLLPIQDCEHPVIHESNSMPIHFIHGFRLFRCEKLGVGIKPRCFSGDMDLSDEEKARVSQVDQIAGSRPYGSGSSWRAVRGFHGLAPIPVACEADQTGPGRA